MYCAYILALISKLDLYSLFSTAWVTSWPALPPPSPFLLLYPLSNPWPTPSRDHISNYENKFSQGARITVLILTAPPPAPSTRSSLHLLYTVYPFLILPDLPCLFYPLFLLTFLPSFLSCFHTTVLNILHLHFLHCFSCSGRLPSIYNFRYHPSSFICLYVFHFSLNSQV